MEDKKQSKKNAANAKIAKITRINMFIIVILIMTIICLKIVDSRRNKIVINLRELPQSSLSMIQKKDNVDYLVIENFIKNLGSGLYSLYNDKYITDKNSDSEDGKYFYIDSIYEAVQFKKDDNKYIKHIKYEDLDRKVDEKGNRILTDQEKNSNDGPQKREMTKMDKIILNQEQFELKHPVEEFNGKIAISLEDAKYAFNMRFDKSKDNKILRIYTIDFLEKQYANALQNFSVDSNYQNRRAIIDGYIFLANEETSKRGVYKLGGSALDKNIIPMKYDDIRYAQNNNNVYCIKDDLVELKNLQTEKTIISAGEYTSISVYSQEKQLYLVSDRTKKFGIIGQDGNTVIPTEFDIIGYDTSFFPEEPEDAGKIIFNKLIPVFKDNKWGFYYADSSKQAVTGQNFVSIGCKKMEYIETNSSRNSEVEEIQLPEEIVENLAKVGYKISGNRINKQVALVRGFTVDKSYLEEGESVFTIPEGSNTGYEGVVVRTEEGLYGIISKDAKKDLEFVLPPNFDRIYKKVENGKSKYYAKYGNNIMELNKSNMEMDLNQNNMNKRQNESQSMTSTNSETEANENTNQNTNTNTNTNLNQNNEQVTEENNAQDIQNIQSMPNDSSMVTDGNNIQ